MNFHSMKRKRLQSLCKRHGIPANLKNKDMADRLSLILKGKENSVSCGSDNAGSEKDMVNAETDELNSSNVNNLKMVAADTVAGNVDEWDEKFVTLRKRSPSTNLEERTSFSPKLLKVSEIERLESKPNLSPEKTRDDTGICDLEEHMQSGINKEQVDDGQEGLQAASGVVVMKDMDLVPVDSEKFGNNLVEAEVDELDDKTDIHDYLSETGEGGAKAEKQGDSNPQGSNINDVNLFLVSPEEYAYPLVEREIPKSDDGGVYNIVNKEQVDDSVMSDADIVHVAPEEFGNYLVEGEVEKLGDKTDLHEDVCGTAKGGAEDEKQEYTNLQGYRLLVSPEEYGYSLVEGEVHKSDDNICAHGGSYNTVNKEQVDDSVMNDEDLVKIASGEFDHYLVEGEVEKLGNKTDIHEDVCGTGIGGSEAEKEVDTNSPQGSNMNDLNPLQISPEESGCPLVEGEVHKSDDNICVHGGLCNVRNGRSEADTITMCLDMSIGAKNTDGKANVTTEHFLDEVHSSSFKDSDGTPVQFPPTYPQSEGKSSDVNIHQMVVSGTATGNADGCEAKFISSQKISLNQDSEKIGFSPKLQNNSGTKGLESEMNLFPETARDDIGIWDVEENMQSGVNNEQVGDRQEVLLVAPSALVMKDVDLLQRSMEECNLVQGELTSLFDNSDVHDDAGGNGAADENQPCVGSPKREKRDMDSLGKYFLNDFQSVDNASGQNSDVTPDEFVLTIPQLGENKSLTFNIHQMFASDEDIYKEKSEFSPKCTPVAVANSEESNSSFPKLLESTMMKKELEIEANLNRKTARDILRTCDMKENIIIAKKEQVGSVKLKETFPKRQPLQDLQQN